MAEALLALLGSGLAFLIGAVLGLLAGLLAGGSRASVRQNKGEAAVSRELCRLTAGPGYHLLNNVTIPYLDGTTQIDHVLVSRDGIFVIEAKNYTGWIFGDARSPQWTQVVYQKKNTFQNPIHQNAKHVRAIRALLDFLPSEQVYSIVVFTGDGEFKTDMPRGVLKLAGLVTHIQSFNTQAISANRMQFCIGRIEYARRAITHQTDVEHQAYLEGKYGRAI